MKTITAALREHLDKDVTALCTCWTITRVDGQVLRFTDADVDVQQGGKTYASIGAYKRTAIETTSSLSVDNLDIVGTASDLALPEEDLRAGLFDNAEITVFMTPWIDSARGRLKMRRGFFGEVQTLPNNTYKVELRGIMQRLSHVYTNIFSATCLYNLGETACGIVIKPADVLRNTAYVVGDIVRAGNSTHKLGKYYNLNIGDPDFEISGSLGHFNSSVYWLNRLGEDFAPNTGSVYSGTYSVRGGPGDGTLTQDIDIETTAGVPLTAIDAGTCYLTVRGWRRDNADRGQLDVQFIDADGVVTPGQATPLTDVGTTWIEVEIVDLSIPANTRYIRLDFNVVLDSPTNANARLDNLTGFIINAAEDSTVLSYTADDVYYTCTVAGTTDTDANSASYNGAAGVDGTTTWVATNAWLRGGRVLSATNARTFICEVSDVRAVDAWFNGGAVIFETGANAGAAMEVKSWDAATNEIELFLSMPANIKSGDYFTMYPGCDKTRISCAAIFGNMTNFFGTPDIPGQDELYRSPDAR